MMRTALLVFSLLLSVAAAAANPTETTETLDIGSRLELFVDEYLIESMDGVKLKLHEPRSAGKILAFDQPWEGNVSWQLSVFQDGGLYRLYYLGRSAPEYARKSALKPGEVLIPDHPYFLCYAESRDGVNWTKPDLGLYEFNGSKQNNILGEPNLLRGLKNPPLPFPFGAPFLDTRPGVDASERYKAPGQFGHLAKATQKGIGLILYSSPDALKWQRWRGHEEPLFTTSLPNAFDSVNIMFWSEWEQQYVFYFRYKTQRVRTFARTTSRDLLDWSEPVPCTFDGMLRPAEHLYTNAVTPYFRAPHIYLSFPKRFVPLRQIREDAPSPGISEAVFMSSRDGIDWHPTMEAFIRPGRDERNWIHRTSSTGAGILATAEDEISLYVCRNYTFPSTFLERFALRTDGFVSVNGPYSGGEFVTRALRFSGSELVLNYATSAAGSIRVEIQDEDGQPIPGFKLEESPILFGDRIEAPVKWRRPGTSITDLMRLDQLAERPIRLRFVIKDADLYSLRFR